MRSRAAERKLSPRSGPPAGGQKPSRNKNATSERGAPARPFVKWAGGKRQLLPSILKYLPDRFGKYHEPFLGGGAVFFRLRPSLAFLSDSNERLIRAYNGVKNHVSDVIAILKTYRNDKEVYLAARKIPIDSKTDAEVAAWLIFLNKTGFNGLYRVNSRNIFNVPFASNANARICDEENLKACAEALRVADLRCEDFDAVLKRASEGDLVYFDPPYVPVSGTSYFTSYTSGGFGVEDQVRLRDVARELKQRGVHVLLSNSSAKLVKDLYSSGFTCVPVAASRLVNSNISRRGKVTEFLIV